MLGSKISGNSDRLLTSSNRLASSPNVQNQLLRPFLPILFWPLIPTSLAYALSLASYLFRVCLVPLTIQYYLSSLLPSHLSSGHSFQRVRSFTAGRLLQLVVLLQL